MAKEQNYYQQIIMDVLGTRPISFNPDLAKVLGSVNASLFLCQLLYWWKKGRNPDMIYKTIDELQEETTLSKFQQLSAQKICVRKGVLTVMYKGIPPKRHFKINIDNLIKLLRASEMAELSSSIRRKTKRMNVDEEDLYTSNFPSDITETTFTENTKQRRRVATRRGDENVTRALEDFHKHFANIPSTSKRL